MKKQPDVYTIRTLRDIIELPSNTHVERCMEELLDYIKWLRIVKKKLGVDLGDETFEWIDDGKSDHEIHVVVINDSKP